MSPTNPELNKADEASQDVLRATEMPADVSLENTNKDLGETKTMLAQKELIPVPKKEVLPITEAEKQKETSSNVLNEQVVALNKLTEEKRRIEGNLSAEGLPEQEKNDLQKQKKELMQKMIEKGCEVLGRSAEEEAKRRSEIREKEWTDGIVAFGYGGKVSYEDRQKQIFIIKELEGRYNELIQNNPNLSKKQKEELLDPRKGDIILSSWPRTEALDKEDVVMAVRLGIDINQIKSAGLFAKKGKLKEIMVGQERVDSVDRLKEIISQEKIKFINEEVQKKIAKKKEEVLGSDEVASVVMEKEINEIKSSILAKQKSEAEVAEKRKETERQAKTEEAKNIPIKERLGYLSNLRIKWEEAGKINRALIDDKRIKIENRILNGVNDEDKKEMRDLKQKLSDEIIDIANTITGRNLREEALTELNRENDMGMDLAWLTEEVQKIYKEQIKQIEESTGKKAKVVKKLISAHVPEQLKNYNPEQEIIMRIPQEDGSFVNLSGFKFIGVKNEGGEDFVVLEKNGEKESVLASLFLQTQEKNDVAIAPAAESKKSEWNYNDWENWLKKGFEKRPPKGKVKKSNIPNAKEATRVKTSLKKRVKSLR